MNVNLKSLIQRDETIKNLEKNVFSKLHQLAGPEIIQQKSGVKIFSFEDAVKDLLSIKKSSKNI
jgi:hypothetical protein